MMRWAEKQNVLESIKLHLQAGKIRPPKIAARTKGPPRTDCGRHDKKDSLLLLIFVLDLPPTLSKRCLGRQHDYNNEQRSFICLDGSSCPLFSRGSGQLDLTNERANTVAFHEVNQWHHAYRKLCILEVMANCCRPHICIDAEANAKTLHKSSGYLSSKMPVQPPIGAHASIYRVNWR